MNDLSMSNARSSDTNGPDLSNVQDWDNMASTVVLPNTLFILSSAVQSNYEYTVITYHFPISVVVVGI